MNQTQAWSMLVAELQRRLDAKESGAALSLLLGKERTYVNRVMSGAITGKRINADEMKMMMRALGLKYQEETPKTAPPEGFSLVPMGSAKLGAGSSWEHEDSVEGHYAFRDDFLLSLGMNAKLRLHKVLGDSMEPTLRHGDLVMVDRSDVVIREGQLYAVGIGDEPLIKRLFTKPDGTIVLKSDNPDYPSWEVSKDERPRIIGRARWVGRVL